ncbi:MAG: GMP synthase, partial [Bryobacteraceae bacterium]
GEPSSRKALAANVRIGNFDFVVIGVHLKSGRTNGDRKKRTAQCQVLAKFIASATAGAEKDVLVLGDYNMVPSQDQANFQALSPAGFLNFVSSPLDGAASHIQSCNPIKGNLLDGYAIAAAHTREFIAGSLRLIRFQQLGVPCSSFAIPSSPGYVADHLPLVARFRVNLKDDD